MSDDVLRERLLTAAADLERVATAVARGGGTPLVGGAMGALERAAAGATGLRNAAGLLDHRQACWDALVAVRDQSDEANDMSEIAGIQMSFEHARYLTTQAYLASTWAVADQVSRVAGRIMCTEDPLKNAAKTPNLWKEFISSGKTAPWLTVEVLQECFGWPIAISYIVRNHFTHEGGVGDGWEFFESRAVTSGFAVSDGAWRYLTKKAGSGNYRVSPAQCRAGPVDPDGRRKLDQILENCHREMDVVLGIIARTSAISVGAYSALLLE